jgi:hypothetical protein
MPIPSFTIDGVLPPFKGTSGPGGQMHDMSPYYSISSEIVQSLGTSIGRLDILEKWLQHRTDLAAIGISSGFQWIDGSFVEDKEPKDMDTVVFLNRPTTCPDVAAFNALVVQNMGLFDRAALAANYKLDAFFVYLGGNPAGIVGQTQYYLNLFSHRRGDYLWKGILRAELGTLADDVNALALLRRQRAAVAQGRKP